MSKFGVELLYINVGLVEQCKESNEFDLLERSISLLETFVTRDVQPDAAGMRLMASTFGLLVTFQTAMGERGDIGYPRSFNRSSSRGQFEGWSDGDY
jgi:hypothetical protein